MTARQLYAAIMDAKGTLSLSEDDTISYEGPKRLAPLVQSLKPQLVAYLRSESVWEKRQIPIKTARCRAHTSLATGYRSPECRAAVNSWNRDASDPVEPTPDKDDPIWGLPAMSHDPVPEWHHVPGVEARPAPLPRNEYEIRALLPQGVRLAAFRPTRPPVLISRLSVVTNVPLFISATLEQLRAAIDGRSWLAGNWSARELVEVLEQVGVKLEMEHRE